MTSINFNSEADCKRAYLNYHCYGNSMQISSSQMGKICGMWENRLSDWQKTMTADVNDYEFDYSFDDSQFKTARNEGYKEAQEKTGYKNNVGDKAKKYTRTAGDAALSGGTALVSFGAWKLGSKAAEKLVTKLGSETAAKKIGETAIGKGISKVASKIGIKTSEKAAKQCGSWAVAAPLALATALLYKAKTPNKTEYEAVMKLYQEYYPEAVQQIAETNEEMLEIAEEIAEKSDEAGTRADEANDDIAEQKARYDMYLRTFAGIQAKIDSGEPLTQEEQEIYNSVIQAMNEIAGEGGVIETIQSESGEDIEGLYGEMGNYQDNYDSMGEVIANIQGQTDFASGFDKATKILCTVEKYVQYVNAGSATWAGIKAAAAAVASFGMNFWADACVAMSATAAVMSFKAADEQGSWAKQIGDAINYREEVEAQNAATQENFDFEIDNYDVTMKSMEELEVITPEDTTAVAASGYTVDDGSGKSGTTTGAGASGGTGATSESDNDPNKKPKQ